MTEFFGVHMLSEVAACALAGTVTTAQENLDNLSTSSKAMATMTQISHWLLFSEVRPRIHCRRRSSVARIVTNNANP